MQAIAMHDNLCHQCHRVDLTHQQLTRDYSVICCLSHIFIKVFYFVTATIRANGRDHVRKWWRAYARMVAINNTRMQLQI